MYLDFFTYQDFFNDIKLHSMNYLEQFILIMQNNLEQNYSKNNMNPFKQTPLIIEEKPDEDHKIIHKNIKEEILAPKGVKKEETHIHFEDTGSLKGDILNRL